MADVETKETEVVSVPEKKVVEEKEAEIAPICEKPVEKKVVEVETDEDSKTSENGSATKEATTNGSSEEKDSEGLDAESEKSEKSTNGSAIESNDVCSLKRKSTGAEVTEVDSAAEKVTSPKKAKLDDKTEAAPVAELNGK